MQRNLESSILTSYVVDLWLIFNRTEFSQQLIIDSNTTFNRNPLSNIGDEIYEPTGTLPCCLMLFMHRTLKQLKYLFSADPEGVILEIRCFRNKTKITTRIKFYSVRLLSLGRFLLAITLKILIFTRQKSSILRGQDIFRDRFSAGLRCIILVVNKQI